VPWVSSRCRCSQSRRHRPEGRRDCDAGARRGRIIRQHRAHRRARSVRPRCGVCPLARLQRNSSDRECPTPLFPPLRQPPQVPSRVACLPFLTAAYGLMSWHVRKFLLDGRLHFRCGFYFCVQAGDSDSQRGTLSFLDFSRHLIIRLSVCFAESIIADQFLGWNSGTSLLAHE
jgi:hypothetical protein